MNDLPIDIPPITPDSFDIRQRSGIKRVLPKTMFGRSLLLIVMPLILVQIISAWVFYARHWETVERRLSADVAGDIATVVEAMKFTIGDAVQARLMEEASSATQIGFSFGRNAALPPPTPSDGGGVEEQLRVAVHIMDVMKAWGGQEAVLRKRAMELIARFEDRAFQLQRRRMS